MPNVHSAATITLTYNGQIIIEGQIPSEGQVPAPFPEKIFHLISLSRNPFILSAFTSALLAAPCWMDVMTGLPLSHADPDVLITFAVILAGSAVFLGEPLTVQKAIGVVLTIAGINVGCQG
ncbi:MAG: hypothetical protein KKB20_29335 [Proteobacteria bacterium]|nr:hypothetical protein [Pseudomonadota bacterium]